jgi:hypothetical protein
MIACQLMRLRARKRHRILMVLARAQALLRKSNGLHASYH